MNKDLLIARIVDKTGYKPHEILAQIDAKKGEMRGLISDEGALFLVAKELGVDADHVPEPPMKEDMAAGMAVLTPQIVGRAESPVAELKSHILQISSKMIAAVHVVDGVSRNVNYDMLNPCMICGALRLCYAGTGSCPVCEGLMTGAEYVQNLRDPEDLKPVNVNDLKPIVRDPILVQQPVPVQPITVQKTEKEVIKTVSNWAEKAKDRHVAQGMYIVIINGIDYRMIFIDIDDETCQDVAIEKLKYMSTTEKATKYQYKVSIVKIGIANKHYAAIAQQEDAKKFDKCLKQVIGETYTLELSPTASKTLGAFVSANKPYLTAGGQFKMVRTGAQAKTKFIFSIPPQGVMPS